MEAAIKKTQGQVKSVLRVSLETKCIVRLREKNRNMNRPTYA